jgi:hypothetical protein
MITIEVRPFPDENNVRYDSIVAKITMFDERVKTFNLAWSYPNDKPFGINDPIRIQNCEELIQYIVSEINSNISLPDMKNKDYFTAKSVKKAYGIKSELETVYIFEYK